MQILTGPKRAVRQVSLSDCGRWVATFRGQYDADLYDRTTGKPAYRVDDFAAHGCAIHPDGKRFFAWGSDGFLVVDTTDLDAEPYTVEPLAYTATVVPLRGRRLVGMGFSGRDESFLGWELVKGRPRQTWRVARNGFLNGPFAVSPNGKWFAAQSVVGRGGLAPVEVRGTRNGRLHTISRLTPDLVLRAVTDSGWPLVSFGGRLILVDAANNRVVTTGKLPGRGAVDAMALSDGTRMLICRDKAVFLLAADTLAVRQAYTFPTVGRPTCVAFAPDVLTAACGTSKGEVVIWDVD